VRPLKNVLFCSRLRQAIILTTPYDLPELPQYHLPELRGRHEYIEYFEDRAKAPLRVKFESDVDLYKFFVTIYYFIS